MSRILMVTPVLKSQRGNSITATRLYNGLSRMGYTIDLLSLDEPDWQMQLEHFTLTESYDLVHGIHVVHFSTVAEHPAIKNIPMIVTTTGTDINYDLDGPGKVQILKTLRRADKIVVFNPGMGSHIITADPQLESRLSVIPQGVDLPAANEVTRKQYGLSEIDTVFIIPSGLRPVKNLDLALDGLAIVQQKHTQLKLLVAGAVIDAVYSDHIKSRLDQLPWAGYIGEVTHSEIGGIMRISDVVLNTSWAEGQPQAVLEAMSLGKPCIMTSVPGNIGIVQNGIHGYYVDTAEDLAEAALRLIENPRLRYDMGSAAQSLVHDRYSAEREINAYADLYDVLLA